MRIPARRKSPVAPSLRLSIAAVVLLALLALTLLYDTTDVKPITARPHNEPAPEQKLQKELQPPPSTSETEVDSIIQDDASMQELENEKEEAMETKTVSAEASEWSEHCDLGVGDWVYDEESRPLYKEKECTFLTEQVTCMRNGRLDDSYQNWRWQPRHCSLPRFEAQVLLERLRNKRMMFVGDSLNRNQWESMVCLVQADIPSEKKTLVKNGSLNVFHIQDYNATIEFYWAPFLVESNADDPDIHSIPNRIIMPTAISKHASNWKRVDYLIFNSYIWWMNNPKTNVLRGSFARRSMKYDEVERVVAFRKVLKTWARWVEEHVDPSKTMVFFMSISPAHLQSDGWGNSNGIKCAMETRPAINWTTPLDVGTDWELFSISHRISRSIKKVHVHFINITAMSEIRKDAHTSVHTLKQGKLLTKEQQADPAHFADCIHWCLPGVPDTWNEFIYARIVSSPMRR